VVAQARPLTAAECDLRHTWCHDGGAMSAEGAPEWEEPCDLVCDPIYPGSGPCAHPPCPQRVRQPWRRAGAFLSNRLMCATARTLRSSRRVAD
jgi:hypothetical protein